MIKCNRKNVFEKLRRILGPVLIIMLLAGSVEMAFMPVEAYASTTIRQGNKIINTSTSESLIFDGSSHESTVYAGEIKRNGETVLNYLYSDDVTRSSVVFDNLRKALPNPYSDMVPAVIQQQTEKGMKELSAATVNNVNLSTLSGNWKEAASIATQIYQGKNTSDAKNELMYDASEECRSSIEDEASRRVANMDNPVATNKRVISHTGTQSKDTVSFRVDDDGQLIEIHDVNLIYLSEATSLIYTTVNVIDNTASGVKKAPQGKDLACSGQAQELVTAGEAESGTMQYALGSDASTAPTTGWSTSIPTASDAGTYHVWYKVVNGDNTTAAGPYCVTVTIKEKDSEKTPDNSGDEQGKTPDKGSDDEQGKTPDKGSDDEQAKNPDKSTDDEAGKPVDKGGEDKTEKDTGKNDADKKDEEHHSSSGGSQTVFNPDAITVIYKVNGTIVPDIKAGKQAQGPLCNMAFKAARPQGWQEAFTFNMAVNDKTDYSLKKGEMTLYVPIQYIKANRQYAILAIDKQGKVHVLADKDLLSNAVTVDLNIEGYSFELIYKD